MKTTQLSNDSSVNCKIKQTVEINVYQEENEMCSAMRRTFLVHVQTRAQRA